MGLMELDGDDGTVLPKCSRDFDSVPVERLFFTKILMYSS